MLIVIIIILIVIALLLLAELFMFSVIEVHLKGMVLVIKVKTPLYHKTIRRVFDKHDTNENTTISDNEMTEDKKNSALNEKLREIKERVFSPDKGFDINELKVIRDELLEMYSYTFGIIKKLLGRLRHKIHISKLLIRLEYGTDNPAATGFVYGSVWNIVGIVYPFLTMYFHIAYPTIDITPDFYSKRFEAEVRSIIKVRAVHIISAGLSSLLVPAITYLKDKNKKRT